MKKGSLVLAGSGIKFLAHLTVETKAYIEQSTTVLYLVNDPAMKIWIETHAKSAYNLDEIYTTSSLRLENYRLITEYIIKTVQQHDDVCVVLYGHPTIFAKPGLDAARRLSQEGFEVRILPAISAEACLYADLMIDPGTCGSQSFETSDFLFYERQFDPSCHLILWQPDIIGHQGKVGTLSF